MTNSKIDLFSNSLLIPVLLQVGLTFLLLFRLAFIRFAVLRSGQVKIRDIALGQRAWPEVALKAQNSFHNQFEVPILFYVAVFFATHFNINTIEISILGYLFVFFRYTHALVHCTSNQVRRRFLLFALGVWSLLILWVILLFRLITL